MSVNASDVTSSSTTSTNSTSSFGAWIAAWTLIIVVLAIIAQTKAGHAIVYYILWLSVVFILVTHNSAITTIFQEGNILQGQQ